MKPSILFRCDASPSVGGGHVVRCLALAKRFKEIGAQLFLVTKIETRQLFPNLDEIFDNIFFIKIEDNLNESIRDELGANKFDALIIDDHKSNNVIEEQLQKITSKLIVLSDNPINKHSCDILIDSNLGRHKVDYEELIPQKCLTLLGSEYIILRDEFTKYPATKAEQKSIVVSVGYTDPASLSEFYLKSLVEIENAHPVDVIIGHAPKALESAYKLAAQANFDLTIHEKPENISVIMSHAFLALGAGGGSVWERCAMGVPSVTIEVASNQKHLLDALNKMGAIIHLGEIENVSQKQMSQFLIGALKDRKKLNSIAQCARTLCDGKGVDRIVTSIMEAL